MSNTNVLFQLDLCLYMYATRFSLSLGNHQACQYKKLITEDIIKSYKI